MLVRQIEANDLEQAAELLGLWRGRPINHQEMVKKLESVRKAGGTYFVAVEAAQLTGFASYTLVPGIAGWYNLTLFVHPAWRLRGVGQQLLLTVRDTVQKLSGAQILLAMLAIEDAEAARFAHKIGATLDKYDWEYELASLENLPPVKLPPGITFHHYNDDTVKAERFVELHHRSFADTPYFQPYNPEEVRQEQEASSEGEMIFACDEKGEDVGVVWLRLDGAPVQKTVLIEPLGIVPQWRRKGLGLALMLEALSRARQLGATRSELGFQSWNNPAKELYERLGYRKAGGKVSYILRLNQSEDSK